MTLINNSVIILFVYIFIDSVSCYNTPYYEQRSSNQLYDGCGSTKLCFGHPKSCFKTKNCTTALGIDVRNNAYTFELLGRNTPGYVAVGLSSDKNMGDDSVVECQQDKGNVNAYSSWTFPKRDPYVSRNNVSQNTIRVLDKSLINGVLYCRFTKDVKSTVNNVQFDLSKDKYYLLLVSGSAINTNSVGFHDILYITTESKVAVSDKKTLYADTKVLYKLHGTFMLIAWLTLTNCGILMARYFKHDWIGRQICGSDIWFAWHRALMISTWVLTMAAFIIIFVEVGGWVIPGNNTHAILGMITIVLCFFQPIGAFFRPHLEDSRRPIFNVMHKSCGTLASVLGIITLFFAVSLRKLALPTWMTYVLAGFVCFHLAIHITLFLLDNVRDGRLDYEHVFQMYRTGENDVHDRRPNVTADEYESRSIVRQVLLGVYVSINVAFLIALICIIWLSPFN